MENKIIIGKIQLSDMDIRYLTIFKDMYGRTIIDCGNNRQIYDIRLYLDYHKEYINILNIYNQEVYKIVQKYYNSLNDNMICPELLN